MFETLLSKPELSLSLVLQVNNMYQSAAITDIIENLSLLIYIFFKRVAKLKKDVLQEVQLLSGSTTVIYRYSCKYIGNYIHF